MDKIITFFDELSIKGEARAIKVAVATLIAVYISSKISFMDATTSSITIYLTYAMFFTVSDSRKYAQKRIISNVYALIISLVIGFIFRWNLYALALVYFLIMIVYFKLSLESKISLVSSGAAAMIFYVGVGNEIKIIHRFISIIIGFIIAILTNELILPTNNGLIVENNIKKLTKSILNIKELIIKNGELDKLNCKELLKQIESIDVNINLLEREIKSKPFRNHLKNYKNKLELFKLLSDVSRKSYLLIEYIYEYRDIFNNLDKEEKINIINIIRDLYNNYKTIIGEIISMEFNKDKIHETINYSSLSLNNKFNLILLAKLLEYEESILKLDNYINVK